jgi:hypothetical protein
MDAVNTHQVYERPDAGCRAFIDQAPAGPGGIARLPLDFGDQP